MSIPNKYLQVKDFVSFPPSEPSEDVMAAFRILFSKPIQEVKHPKILKIHIPNGKSFSAVITSKIRLENPSERIVFFKIKTTASKHFCVHPNASVIKPGSYAEISILLQPVDDPSILRPQNVRPQLRLFTAFSSKDNTPVDEFWKTVSPADVMESDIWIAIVTRNAGFTQKSIRPITH